MANSNDGKSSSSNGNSSKPPQDTDVPKWVRPAGYASGLITLLFFMAMILFQIPVTQENQFLINVVLALGVALSFAFIGGDAAAKGNIPTGGLNPVQFSVGGGLAAFVIVLLLAFTVTNLSQNTNGVPTIVPTFTPTPMTDNPTPTFTPLPPTNTPVSLDSITGSWLGRDGSLTITVNEIEIISRESNGKLLKYKITVDNQTNDDLSIPLFGSFTARGNDNIVYEDDTFGSDWPRNFPARQKLVGYIDLEDSVPNEVTSMTVVFSPVYGSFEVDSVTISDIPIP